MANPPVSDGRIIESIVRRTFPHPVACAWQRVYVASSDADRLARLRNCLDTLLLTLVGLLLPDYLRGRPCDSVETMLPLLKKPSTGHLLQLTRELARALAAREEILPFIPEILGWLQTGSGRPTDAARLLETLVRIRNDDAHGASPMGPLDWEERATRFRVTLVSVLGSLRWLAGYRLFRILQATPRRRGFRGQIQFLAGHEDETEPIVAEWNAHLQMDVVYLCNPRGDAVLEVSPFFVTAPHPETRAPMCFLFRKVQNSRKLTYRHDGSGIEKEAGPLIDGTQVSFDRWLDQRTSLGLQQPLDDPLGAFHAPHMATGDDRGVIGNRFKVLDILGAGGMAEVFRVIDLEFDEQVALKVMRENVVDDNQLRQRFQREVKTMQGLNHPCILPVHNYGTLPDGRLFLTTAIMPGGSLRTRIGHGCQDEPTILRWLISTLSALEYLHAEHVTHRDIKPENLLLNDHDEVTLADFGIALRDADPRLTTGQQMGSLPYMAPELRSGREPGPASDMFSLAVVFHEVLTGTLPDDSPGEGIPGSLGRILKAMGALDPTARPGASETLEQVRALAEAVQPGSERPASGVSIGNAAPLEEAAPTTYPAAEPAPDPEEMDRALRLVRKMEEQTVSRKADSTGVSRRTVDFGFLISPDFRPCLTALRRLARWHDLIDLVEDFNNKVTATLECHADVKLESALAFEQLGNHDRAQEIRAIVLAMTPDREEPFQELVRWSKGTQDWEEVMARLSASMYHSPFADAARKRTAARIARDHLHDREGAAEWLQDAEGSDPSS